jgi:exocyst complex component 3
MDIEVQFSELLSSRWQNTTDAVDTVCATLDDYFQDYNYLKPNNFKKVISLAQVCKTTYYLTYVCNSRQ